MSYCVMLRVSPSTKTCIWMLALVEKPTFVCSPLRGGGFFEPRHELY